METIYKKTGERFEIILNNRGASGLIMMYTCDHPENVSVEKTDPIRPAQLKPGDPVKIGFSILALKKGTARILFYETQPWNKDFEAIPVKELMVHVD